MFFSLISSISSSSFTFFLYSPLLLYSPLYALPPLLLSSLSFLSFSCSMFIHLWNVSFFLSHIPTDAYSIYSSCSFHTYEQFLFLSFLVEMCFPLVDIFFMARRAIAFPRVRSMFIMFVSLMRVCSCSFHTCEQFLFLSFLVEMCFPFF